MHYVAYSLVALFLAGIAATVIALKHAPEGYEDAAGFHPGTAACPAAKRARSRRRAPGDRDIPTLLATH